MKYLPTHTPHLRQAGSAGTNSGIAHHVPVTLRSDWLKYYSLTTAVVGYRVIRAQKEWTNELVWYVLATCMVISG